MVVFDLSSPDFGGIPVEYRMWRVVINSSAKTVSCQGGGVSNISNTGQITGASYRKAGFTGQATGHAEIHGQNTGSGESYTVGMIRPADVRAGSINHAIRIACPYPRFWNQVANSYVYPATRSEDQLYAAKLISYMPMGARLSFQRTYNWTAAADAAANRLSDAKNKAFARMFIKAWYEYGLIALDGGGTHNVYMEADMTAKWTDLIGKKNGSGTYNDIARAVTASVDWTKCVVYGPTGFSGYANR